MIGMPVPIDVARARIEESAEHASSLGARLAAEALASASTSVILAQRPGLDQTIDNHGRSLTWDEVAPVERAWFGGQGDFTLIVEDEWAEKGEPHQEDAAFLDTSVIRWVTSSDGYEPIRRFIQGASAGIFLTAYLCRAAPEELGLAAGHDLDSPAQDRIFDSAAVLLNTVFDGEAFLATLLRHTPDASRGAKAETQNGARADGGPF